MIINSCQDLLNAPPEVRARYAHSILQGQVPFDLGPITQKNLIEWADGYAPPPAPVFPPTEPIEEPTIPDWAGWQMFFLASETYSWMRENLPLEQQSNFSVFCVLLAQIESKPESIVPLTLIWSNIFRGLDIYPETLSNLLSVGETFNLPAAFLEAIAAPSMPSD